MTYPRTEQDNRTWVERVCLAQPNHLGLKTFALIFASGAAGYLVAELVIWIQAFAA